MTKNKGFKMSVSCYKKLLSLQSDGYSVEEATKEELIEYVWELKDQINDIVKMIKCEEYLDKIKKLN